MNIREKLLRRANRTSEHASIWNDPVLRKSLVFGVSLVLFEALMFFCVMAFFIFQYLHRG